MTDNDDRIAKLETNVQAIQEALTEMVQVNTYGNKLENGFVELLAKLTPLKNLENLRNLENLAQNRTIMSNTSLEKLRNLRNTLAQPDYSLWD